MTIIERFFTYSDSHRSQVAATAAASMAVVAFADWQIATTISLGFLYIIPMVLASSLLAVRSVLVLAAVSSLLREEFLPAAWTPGAAERLALAWVGFALSGYFVSELNRNRRLVLRSLRDLEEQIRLRQTAEQQVRILIETSPLAILALDGGGQVVLANRAAGEMLGFGEEPMEGVDVRAYLPILGRILKSQTSRELRTTVECKALRKDKEVFLAQIWLSTYVTASGPGLAAVIWDASENLRDREGAGLDSMMATSRVLIGAVSHEIRNLACAATAAHAELAGRAGAESADASRVLGSILQGLARIASSGLALSAERGPVVTELGAVLDEARIVIEPGIREDGGAVKWKIASGLPLVQADRHGLLQVFLNLARNSQRAIAGAAVKELTVEARLEEDLVLVRFVDTGGGAADPESLFRPFQSGSESSGLGLYISRAILRAHGGDLHYEPRPPGSCFTVELWPAEDTAHE